MKRFALLLAVFMTASLFAEPVEPVRMEYFRNFYSGSVNRLEKAVLTREIPWRTRMLPDFTARDPWTRKRTENISKLYAVVLSARVAPKENGMYTFLPSKGPECVVWLSPDNSAAHAVKYDAKSVSLSAGKTYFLRAGFIPKGGSPCTLLWSRDGAAPERIPADCLLAPEERPLEGVPGIPDAVRVPEGPASDDEPDSLSRELYSMDLTLLRDFFVWAAANPPPDAGTRIAPDQAPYLRIKAASLVTDNANWHAGKVEGEDVLLGPGGHNFWDSGTAEFTLPEDGVYRLWIRYRHKQGNNETFTLTLREAPSATSPATDGIEPYIVRLQQMFARSQGFPGRFPDPIPEIRGVPANSGNFHWEASHKTVFLKKGRYTVRFSGGQYDRRPDIAVSDLVFTADPMLDPGKTEVPVGAGVLPASEDWKSPLYALRPGADGKALTPWQKAWEKALLDKLAVSEYTDYFYGLLASLVRFEPETNRIGRVAELRAQKAADDSPLETHKFSGRDFHSDNGWKHSEFYEKNYTCVGNISGPGKSSDATAFYEISVKTPGIHVLWFNVYGWGGVTAADVTLDGKPVTTMLLGLRDGFQWVHSGLLNLVPGTLRITLRCVANPADPKREGARVVTRGLLTQCTGFTPDREADYPDGMDVGPDSLGFWRSPDPWAGFTRYSRPGMLYYTPYAPVKWKLVPPEEINKTEHAVSVRAGEVLSELLIVRNNTDSLLVLTPEVRSELPVTLRVVTDTLMPTGQWSPMLLLRRSHIGAPAKQNTGLWITADCRNAAEGVYPVVVKFADRTVTYRVAVSGSASKETPPLIYPYAAPYPRKSCFEAFQDLGINLVTWSGMSKKLMNQYGFVMQIGSPASAKTPETIRSGVAKAERLGLAPEDYCWYLIDEPGPNAIPEWLRMAESIRKIDPRLRIWCNLGGVFPEVKDLPAIMKIMPYWDVSCPYQTHFGAKKDAYKPYFKLLCETGKVRLMYETPCIGTTEKVYWAPHQMLEIGARAAKREYNRHGWAFFSLIYGTPYDDVYAGNQDSAVSMYPGSFERTIQTRNSEAVREAAQRWHKIRQEGDSREQNQ